MRVINADEYMERLRANIDTTADIVAKQLKRDEPCGTVKDGGQIGYLWALQWARNTLELDYYTVQAIPIPNNATNGDIRRMIFPSEKVMELENIVVVMGENKEYQHHYSKDFWNAPYKELEILK